MVTIDSLQKFVIALSNVFYNVPFSHGTYVTNIRTDERTTSCAIGMIISTVGQKGKVFPNNKARKQG